MCSFITWENSQSVNVQKVVDQSKVQVITSNSMEQQPPQIPANHTPSHSPLPSPPPPSTGLKQIDKNRVHTDAF